MLNLNRNSIPKYKHETSEASKLTQLTAMNLSEEFH